MPQLSEWIAYGEVETESVLEAWNIVKAALACVVGQVQPDTQIKAKDKKVKVITDAESCTDSQLTPKVLDTEDSIVVCGMVFRIV